MLCPHGHMTVRQQISVTRTLLVTTSNEGSRKLKIDNGDCYWRQVEGS